MRDADAEHLLRQDVIDALFEVRNLSARPLVRRLVISRRNTPDFVHGSRNFTVLSAQMFAPSWSAAHASASVSSIRFANSGGVNTSSFERLAMHVSTSGLRPRSAKLACVAHAASFGVPPRSGGQLAHRHRRVGLGRREDLVLAEMGEERALRAESR